MAEMTKNHILHACRRLSAWVRQTPCIHQTSLSQLISDRMGHPVQLFLKYEGEQKSGSFKYRGAMNRLLALGRIKDGIVTCSTGNHALAVSAAAKELSSQDGQHRPVNVVVKSNTAAQKLRALEAAGVNMIGHGQDSMKACRHVAASLEGSMGYKFLDPAHPDTTAGQATASVEFSQQVWEQTGAGLDAIILPCGGGSLLAGSAVFFAGSGTSVFSAEPAQAGPRLAESLGRMKLQAHNPLASTVADGLNTCLWGENWAILRRSGMLAGAMSVPDTHIMSALRLHQATADQPVEPTSCVALAAALFYHKTNLRVRMRSGRPLMLGVIMTGSNVGRPSQDQGSVPMGEGALGA